MPPWRLRKLASSRGFTSVAGRGRDRGESTSAEAAGLVSEQPANAVSCGRLPRRDSSCGRSSLLPPRNHLPFFLLLAAWSLYCAALFLFGVETAFVDTEHARHNLSPATMAHKRSDGLAPHHGTDEEKQRHSTVKGAGKAAPTTERWFLGGSGLEIRALNGEKNNGRSSNEDDGEDGAVFASHSRPAKNVKKKSGRDRYADGEGRAVVASHSRPKNVADKKSPHTRHQKKDEQRKFIRGRDNKLRRVPQGKRSVVDSALSSAAAPVGGSGDEVHAINDETGDSLPAAGDDPDSATEGTGVPAPPAASSTDDLVIGLAVTAAVSVVALLGAVAYIAANRGWRGANDVKKGEDQTRTEPGSDTTSDRSDDTSNNEMNESVSSRSRTEGERNSLHSSGRESPGAQNSTTSSYQNAALFSVSVPDHVRPGQDFRVLAGGQVVCVRCPPNSKPGSKVQIVVREGPAPGEAPQEEEPSISPSPSSFAEARSAGAFLQDTGNEAGARNGERILATNPQEGASNMFEVVVPHGVGPGQYFLVMADGAKILVPCPMNASEGRKLVFQFPNEIASRT